MEAYEKLLEKHREIYLLHLIGRTLSWDTYTFLPPGAVSQRADQNALFVSIWHRMATDKEIDNLLHALEKKSVYESLSQVQKRNLFLMRRSYDMDTQVPEDLYRQLEKQRTITNNAREKALAKNDWSIFEPEFEKMFTLVLEYAQYIQDIVGASDPYDACVDIFEMGMRAEHITKVFDELKAPLNSMIEKYADISQDLGTDFLNRSVEKDTQIRLIERLAEFVGYDLKSDKAIGHIAECVHPGMVFGKYDDVRIGLRFEENNFFQACSAFMHESGHALYDMNLNREWQYQPVGHSSGFSVHESQSIFLENMIGKSPEFIRYFLPILNETTDGQFKDISVDEFVRAVNQVRPGPIRVTADELTYTSHIIIRFEIEKALFDNKIEISDIPSVWNELYEEYLGVTVNDDAEGALQDLHWGVGQYGHFPMYALGNIFSAQLAEAMSEQMPDWRDQIANGDISDIVSWMSENIHKKGRLYDAPDLMRRVTGEDMSCEPYLKYLQDKFSSIFS